MPENELNPTKSTSVLLCGGGEKDGGERGRERGREKRKGIC